MSNFLVGSQECSVPKVVTTLMDSQAYHLLVTKFGELSMRLNTDRVKDQKLRSGLQNNTIELCDALRDLLDEWVARLGHKANIIDFIEILEKVGLSGCADPLKSKFLGTFGSEDLFGAIQNNDVSLVRAVVKCINSNTINLKNGGGKNAIWVAAETLAGDNFLRVMNCLIDGGCNTHIQNEGGDTFLHELLKRKALSPSQFHDCVVFLIDKGCGDLFNVDNYGSRMNPFLFAVKYLDMEERTLSLLMEHEVELEVVNTKGRGCLFNAIKRGRSINFLSALMGYGVDVRSGDEYGKRVSHWLAEYGPTSYTGARESELFAITKLFVENEVNFDDMDEDGNTPLMLAIKKSRSMAYIKYLVELGVNLEVNYNESTLLGFAAEYGSLEIMEYILTLEGADVNECDYYGESALHCAVKTEKTECAVAKVKLLLSKGADPSIHNNDGLKPVDVLEAECNCEQTKDELKKLLK